MRWACSKPGRAITCITPWRSVLAALLLRDGPSWRASAAAQLFFTGIVLFCGSLYGLALTGDPLLGFVTPLGGIAFVAGWLFLALAALHRP